MFHRMCWELCWEVDNSDSSQPQTTQVTFRVLKEIDKWYENGTSEFRDRVLHIRSSDFHQAVFVGFRVRPMEARCPPGLGEDFRSFCYDFARWPLWLTRNRSKVRKVHKKTKTAPALPINRFARFA